MTFAFALTVASLIAATPTTNSSAQPNPEPVPTVGAVNQEAERWQAMYEARIARALGERWRATVVYAPATETATVVLTETGLAQNHEISGDAAKNVVAAILPPTKATFSHQIIFANQAPNAVATETTGSGMLQLLGHIITLTFSLALMSASYLIAQAAWSMRRQRDQIGDASDHTRHHDANIVVPAARTAA